ncbi:Stage V sporulation protein D [Photobacterium damselae subsp. piscicida]|uniref:Peptidoglycan D,D-transpeptidase MrdA n=3 Tax=Photobacterium damselae TaxID=38293 RepID=A0A1V1V5A9_PHODP|nr:penicillin-binding protein 2 [Photobacterium damselae]MBE8128579.1 penicillin-binding protein 2 [Photobacterium damselae subsp. piscicida]PSV76404.1 penicillin-binding protein 2 [Photobacterium damselae]PSW78850.1 penicillin-binding protein 2 [Photobacterium damselae]QOD53281.1 penicillin-binding protein 2 [Photobacterium damselae subsp. piscicida]QOD57118.1 penicillin-binding protein 2 [Photobacterium damselae subsp. piscicida]
MRQKRTQIRDHRAESALFFRRALVSFIGIAVLVGVLLTNLYHIQVQEHEDYQTRSNDNRIKIVPVSPNRGLIYDRNGVLLAENRPVYSLEITSEKVPNLEETLLALQEIMGVTEDDITKFQKERRRTRRFKSVPILDQLNEEQVALFSVNQHRFPGVEVKAYLKRHYPYGDALTHVLGYVAKINDRDIKRLEKAEKLSNYKATRDIGKLGIERYYEDQLHGTSGYQEVEVNSRGRVIRTLKYVPPIPGQDLKLNIDIALQLYVQELLTERSKDPATGEEVVKHKRGSVVVLDPKDDSILAMVSSPSYDPNLFVKGISGKNYRELLNNPDRPLVNRVTLGIYPPASTVKPLIAVAALTEGVVTTKTTRNDPGWWVIPNSTSRKFRDWLRWGHGSVNIYKAIEESVDTYFYQVAYDMGIDRLSTWMSKFGYGEYTGVDIHEESKANMPTREWKQARYRQPWYQGDTIPVGIGQGYWTATPLQIAKATSVLVNNGVVHRPHLLQSTIEDGVETKTEFKDFPPITGVKQSTWDVAKEGMHRVLYGHRGTARKAFYHTPYQAGGKSGSAQVFGLAENQKYNADELEERLRDHALFTAFAPFEDPKVVVSMVLENAGGGSSNGGPIARKIFDHMLLEPSAVNDLSKTENNKTASTEETQ